MLAAAPASATTISRDVDYDDRNGFEPSADILVRSVSAEQDDFTVTRDERRIVFNSRPGARLLAGDGCKQHGTRVVTCSRSHLSAIYVNGARGDDRVRVKLPRWRHVTLQVFGGPGRDELVTQGPDALVFGEGGDDTLVGGRGQDELNGGPGDDRLRGREGDDYLAGDGIPEDGEQPSGDDRLDGGPGRDFASWGVWGVVGSAGIAVDLAARVGGRRGERDALHSIENVLGGAGPDILRGDSEPNVLLAAAGRDALVGRAGDDHLGLATDDPYSYEQSSASDGVRDSASCGAGADSVTAGGEDEVAADCETSLR